MMRPQLSQARNKLLKSSVIIAAITIASSALPGCGKDTTAPAPPPPAQWASTTAMTSARSGQRAEIVTQSIYVIGGHEADDVATVEALNTTTGVWTTRRPLSTPRNYPASGVIAGIIYVAGGYSPGATLRASGEKYNPATDTWSAIAAMPIANAGMACAVWNGRLYVFGGDADRSAVYQYDPGTDQWAAKASLPNPRTHARAAALNGMIYVVGGDASSAPAATVDVYDSAANTWSSGPNLPTAAKAPSVVAFGGKIWSIGGEGATSASAAVHELTPGSVWVAGPSLPSGVGFAGAATTNTCIYTAGGLGGTGVAVSAVYRLCP